MKTESAVTSKGAKIALILCGALLTGMLWRVRGTHGWGSSWGLLNVGFVLILFLASFVRVGKTPYGVIGLAAFSFMLTTPAWGTLNSQITGVLSVAVPGEETVDVAVSPVSGIILMLLMGFGLAGVFGVMLGICFGKGKRVIPEMAAVAAAALIVSYAAKASVAHPLVRLIEPQAAKTFAEGLAGIGADTGVYKAYLAHFNSESWAKHVFGGRNYYACVSAVSAALGAVAAAVTARFAFGDRFAAKTGAAVCSSFAFAITLSDLFFFFSDGGFRHSQGFSLPDGFAAWSLWEYFTGFIAGGLITYFILKNVPSRDGKIEIQSGPGNKVLNITGYVIFAAAAAVNAVRPALVRYDFAAAGIVIAVAAGAGVLALCAVCFKKGRLFGFGDVCPFLCVLFVVYDFVIYMFAGDEPNISSLADAHNILVCISAAYCAVIIPVFRRSYHGKDKTAV